VGDSAKSKHYLIIFDSIFVFGQAIHHQLSYYIRYYECSTTTFKDALAQNFRSFVAFPYEAPAAWCISCHRRFSNHLTLWSPIWKLFAATRVTGTYSIATYADDRLECEV